MILFDIAEKIEMFFTFNAFKTILKFLLGYCDMTSINEEDDILSKLLRVCFRFVDRQID